jgi:hypothetical protein
MTNILLIKNELIWVILYIWSYFSLIWATWQNLGSHGICKGSNMITEWCHKEKSVGWFKIFKVLHMQKLIYTDTLVYLTQRDKNNIQGKQWVKVCILKMIGNHKSGTNAIFLYRDQISANQMYVYKMSVDKMFIHKMSVDKISVNKMYVDKMSVD